MDKKTSWFYMLVGYNIGLWCTLFTMEHNKVYKDLVEKNKIEICKDYKKNKDEIKQILEKE